MMKLTLTHLLLLTVCIALLVGDSKEWGRRRRQRSSQQRRSQRRWFAPIFSAEKVICSSSGKKCSLICHLMIQAKACGPNCVPVCKRTCQQLVGKRDQEAVSDIQRSETFPNDFNVYDADRNGEVDLEEFSRAINSHDISAREAFKLGDSNVDGTIDAKEFSEAPYHFDADELNKLKARFLSEDNLDDSEDDDEALELARELEDMSSSKDDKVEHVEGAFDDTK